ncbi:hypothetical protein MKW92_046229 [Papaver armeniacum]|nr:hypothetical protein MKW92_046229 [Papaver armeniacum]
MRGQFGSRLGRKSYTYLIEEDSYFTYLHLARSKARPSLIYVIPLLSGHDDVFLTTDLSLDKGRGRADIHTMMKTNMFSCDYILRPLNGLMCFVDCQRYAVCIYNISTREVSPWIQSTLLQDEKEKRPEIHIHEYHLTSYKFGFDPATKEHKVLCMWYITPGEADSSIEEDCDDYIEVCEILTLGSGSWRRIHEVPPFFLDDCLPNVYVNGSIYWCSRMFTNPQIGHGYPSCIVAFDVGSEKFRVIQIPGFIRDQPLDPDTFFDHFVRLVELDGRVGIIRRISAFTSKLWIFNDHHHHGKEKVNKTESGEYWIEETITLPFPWTRTTSLNIYVVVGTHQIVLQTYQGPYRHMNNVSLYSYHCKEKTFTEIKTSGAPLSVPDACTMKML